MNRSRAWFDSAARETGYRAETLEKVVRLGELAGEVARHPLLGAALALKGGTAINLGFGPPRRLSVDLDYNFIGSEDRHEMLKQRPLVERALESLARGRGYELQWSRAEHAGRKAYLRYFSTAGVADRIEVDLNFLHRVALDSPFLAELWQPADADRPSLKVVGIGELVAGKLCALLDRGAPRDLFDAAHLPTVAGARWGSDRMRSLFVALAGTLHSCPPSAAGRGRAQGGGPRRGRALARVDGCRAGVHRPPSGRRSSSGPSLSPGRGSGGAVGSTSSAAVEGAKRPVAPERTFLIPA